MKALAIDHISIAVRDLKKACEIYEKVLGLRPQSHYVMEEAEYIRGARYRIGEVVVELMESTSSDGEVAKFVEKRGEGIFLISYLVPDVKEALADLKCQGLTLIDEKPREHEGARYAFTLHPKEFCGVLTEIVDQSSRDL